MLPTIPSSATPAAFSKASEPTSVENLIQLIQKAGEQEDNLFDIQTKARELSDLFLSKGFSAVMEKFFIALCEKNSSIPPTIKRIAFKILIEALIEYPSREKTKELAEDRRASGLTWLEQIARALYNINPKSCQNSQSDYDVIQHFWESILSNQILEMIDREVFIRQLIAQNLSSGNNITIDIARHLLINSKRFQALFLTQQEISLPNEKKREKERENIQSCLFLKYFKIATNLIDTPKPNEWAKILVIIAKDYPGILDEFMDYLLDDPFRLLPAPTHSYRYYHEYQMNRISRLSEKLLDLLRNICTDPSVQKKPELYYSILRSLFSQGRKSDLRRLFYSVTRLLDFFEIIVNHAHKPELKEITPEVTSLISLPFLAVSVGESSSTEELALINNLLKKSTSFCKVFPILSDENKRVILKGMNEILKKDCTECKEVKEIIRGLLQNNEEFSRHIAVTYAKLPMLWGEKWHGINSIRRFNEGNYTKFGESLVAIECEFDVSGSICENANKGNSWFIQSKTQKMLQNSANPSKKPLSELCYPSEVISDTLPISNPQDFNVISQTADILKTPAVPIHGGAIFEYAFDCHPQQVVAPPQAKSETDYTSTLTANISSGNNGKVSHTQDSCRFFSDLSDPDADARKKPGSKISSFDETRYIININMFPEVTGQNRNKVQTEPGYPEVKKSMSAV